MTEFARAIFSLPESEPEGVTRLVPIAGGYRVWTRSVGAGDVNLLLLHGGPGANHEYLECFAPALVPHGVRVHFYDQLGSYYSEQPEDPDLWRIERFTDEVEDVRRALGLDRLFVLGQSWGGMLAIEYALAYPEHLDGLVVSNMTGSMASYVRYVRTLRAALPEGIRNRMDELEARGAYHDPEYETLVVDHLYKRHLCRRDPWPDAVRRGQKHINPKVYEHMNGPTEFLVTGVIGTWDRWDDLGRIRVPTLLMVGRQDTVSVGDLQEMARRIPESQLAVCDGGHLTFWDDPEAYFSALTAFLIRPGDGQPA